MEYEHAGRTRAPEGLDVTLGDLLRFADWMEEARHALTAGETFPEEPSVSSDRVRTWLRRFGTLYRRRVEGDAHQLVLEARLRSQEDHLARLATTLYENIGSLHDSLGHEERARDARKRAACFLQIFMLRGKRVV